MGMTNYIIYSLILFTLSMMGLFFFHRHMLSILISLELMILAVNLNFALVSIIYDDLLGQIYVLFVLTIAAAETALGLAIFLIHYRLYGGIFLRSITLLKG